MVRKSIKIAFTHRVWARSLNYWTPCKCGLVLGWDHTYIVFNIYLYLYIRQFSFGCWTPCKCSLTEETWGGQTTLTLCLTCPYTSMCYTIRQISFGCWTPCKCGLTEESWGGQTTLTLCLTHYYASTC